MIQKNRPLVYFLINLFLKIISPDKNKDANISKLSSNQVVGKTLTSTFHIVTQLLFSHGNHTEFNSIFSSLKGIIEVSTHIFTVCSQTKTSLSVIVVSQEITSFSFTELESVWTD